MELTDYVLNDIPESYADKLDDRSAYRFADQAARSSIGILNSGQIYNGWEEMDDFVNGVMDKVIPDELRDREYVRAYVIKDGSTNAFMMPTGIFCINIGMIAEIESEANLAGIIGHELAHYELRHSLERYVRAESGEFDNSILFNQRKALSGFSVQNELDSDARAAEHLTRSGYDLNGLAETFSVFKRSQDKILLRLKDKWKLKETSHPSPGRRVDKINEMIDESTAEGKSNQILTDLEFKQLRKEARVEVLKYLLSGFRYRACLEKAFRYHLFEPNNPTYIYYAMEAIRRAAYLDVTLWNKKFLADGYYDVVQVGQGKKKVSIEGHFFDEFRPAILTLDSNSFNKIPAKFYWNDPKFTTYEEAYAFFYKVGKALKVPEVELSNALSLSFDKEKQDRYLRAYLEYGEVRYRDFAEAMLEGKIYEALPDRKTTVFNRLVPLIKNGVDNIMVWHQGDDLPLRKAIKSSVETFDDRNFLYMPDLAEMKVNDYLLLSALESFSFRPLYARGDKTQLHILDPALWETMKAYGTNRLEFINVVYNDKERGDFDMATYKKVSDATWDDILSREEEKGRYVKMYVSGFQISEKGPMKLSFYDFPDKLANKGNGYEQLKALLTKKLNKLDEEVQKSSEE